MRSWGPVALASALTLVSVGEARADVTYDVLRHASASFDLEITLPNFITATSAFPIADFTVLSSNVGELISVTFTPGDVIDVNFGAGEFFEADYPAGSFLMPGDYV